MPIAIKSLPVVRSYVVDPHKELVRPDCKRTRKWFAEADLFEPGKAVLTAQGKKRLDGAAEWLNGPRRKKARSFWWRAFAAAGPKRRLRADGDPEAERSGQRVSQALRIRFTAPAAGGGPRAPSGVGCGTTPTPVPETEKLAAARIELIVFVPR